jgi:hypothetical protein
MDMLANQVASAVGALALLITIFTGGAAMARDFTKEDSNKALVQASFDRWKNGTGGPFSLRFRGAHSTSALPPIAPEWRAFRNRRFEPKADTAATYALGHSALLHLDRRTDGDEQKMSRDRRS